MCRVQRRTVRVAVPGVLRLQLHGLPLWIHAKLLDMLRRLLQVGVRGVLQRQLLLPLFHQRRNRLRWMQLCDRPRESCGVSALAIGRRTAARSLSAVLVGLGLLTGVALHQLPAASADPALLQFALVSTVGVAVGWAGAASP